MNERGTTPSIKDRISSGLSYVTNFGLPDEHSQALLRDDQLLDSVSETDQSHKPNRIKRIFQGIKQGRDEYLEMYPGYNILPHSTHVEKPTTDQSTK